MDFVDFQRAVLRLSQEAWPTDHQLHPEILRTRLTALLLEEAGELAQVIRKLEGPRLGHTDQPTTMGDVLDEVGDVLFILARLCNHLGIGLEGGAHRVNDKIRLRIWEADRNRDNHSRTD